MIFWFFDLGLSILGSLIGHPFSKFIILGYFKDADLGFPGVERSLRGRNPPRRLRNRCPATIACPARYRIDPENPRRPQESPGDSQETPKRRPGDAQETPRRSPGDPQDIPRRPQETARRSPGDPRRLPRDPNRLPGKALGNPQENPRRSQEVSWGYPGLSWGMLVVS